MENVINEKIIKAWERLHYPSNKKLNPDIQIIHVQFGDSAVSRKQTVEAINQDIDLGLSELHDVLNKRNYEEEQLSSLNKQYHNLQSTGNSERYDEIKADLEIANAKISKLDIEKGSLEREIKTKEQEHNSINASFERVQKHIRDTAGDSHLYDKADKVLSALNELTQLNQASIYGRKIKHIAQSATEAHHQLSSKNKPYSIEIEPTTDQNGDSKVNIFIKDHKSDTVDIVHLSAGEQQILATALLAGLASATSKLVPFVTDTPAGRLDESHRQNLLEFWTNGQQGRQIIILSQNTEITFDVYQNIKNKVSKVFLLRKQLDELGFDETTVLENSYFGVNA
jgi:DNA sulfur modification protein DndD